MVDPDLIDFNVVSNGDSKNISVSSATVECLLLPPEQFNSICCQMDGAQKLFFCFIIKYIL